MIWRQNFAGGSQRNRTVDPVGTRRGVRANSRRLCGRCPGSPPSEYHTTGFDDLKGCALAITYKSNVSDVQPEDFTVFSVNQTCVWSRFTEFSVPERMPPCPNGKCICAWFWIHSQDSGGEQSACDDLPICCAY